MLKILKINVPVTLKADSDDLEDVKDRLYEFLSIGMEDGDLEFEIIDDESEELELEE